MSSSHRPKTLHFITGNANKLVEVQAILGIGGKDGSPTVELTSKKLDLEEIQGSIEQIARAKASTAAKEVGICNAPHSDMCVHYYTAGF